MNEYLVKKGFDEDMINKTIEKLLEQKYLDDEIFTRAFVESRINHKPKSKFALAYELNKKGINSAVIENILKNYDDQVLARKAIEPKIKLWLRLDFEKFKKKVLNFLQYRGFTYEIAISILNKLTPLEEHLGLKDKNEN
jgi:regulatory protein